MPPKKASPAEDDLFSSAASFKMNINQPSEKYIVIPGIGKKKISTGDVENQAPTTQQSRRLRALSWMPNRVRNHFIAMIGEFVGTFMFLFFAFSATQIANTGTASSSLTGVPNTSDLMYIALAFGFSLAVNVWVFFRISGGLFNPAVTLGMCLIGAVGWFRGLLIFVTQMVGGIAAAGIVSCLYPNALNVRTQLRNTSIVRGLFIEMFLTFMLVFTVFMLAAEKHKGTFLAPIGIGLALFIAELSGVYFTGGSLNPARSFGPDVILHTFDGYHWIYWVGPALGSLLAVVIYRLIKSLEYETANPGQDFDENEIEAFDPGDDPKPEDVRRPQVYGVTSEQLAAIASRDTTTTTPDGATTAYAPSSPRHSHDHKKNNSIGPNTIASSSVSGGGVPSSPRTPNTASFKTQQQQSPQQRHHHNNHHNHHRRRSSGGASSSSGGGGGGYGTSPRQQQQQQPYTLNAPPAAPVTAIHHTQREQPPPPPPATLPRLGGRAG
ncbi:Aquaporin-1 [Diplodia intermedia]|uniref:Aquaporin-1 n=1 Tax=Diplodia intermedia TaxID=856260 RepID=A0ABR3U1N9_9PEZI